MYNILIIFRTHVPEVKIKNYNGILKLEKKNNLPTNDGHNILKKRLVASKDRHYLFLDNSELVVEEVVKLRFVRQKLLPGPTIGSEHSRLGD